MTITSFQVAFLTVTLLLPGYIASTVLAARRARRRDARELEFFRWLALGAVSIAPWLVFVFLVAGDRVGTERGAWQYAVDHRWIAAPLWLLVVFVWPFLVGEGLARLQNQPGRLTRRYIRQSARSHASAWDAKFSEMDQEPGDWVLVILKDDNWVAGALADRSQASIEPGERDLYVSQVHYTSFDRGFGGVHAEGGMLLMADEIRVIRFWPGILERDDSFAQAEESTNELEAEDNADEGP